MFVKSKLVLELAICLCVRVWVDFRISRLHGALIGLSSFVSRMYPRGEAGVLRHSPAGLPPSSTRTRSISTMYSIARCTVPLPSPIQLGNNNAKRERRQCGGSPRVPCNPRPSLQHGGRPSRFYLPVFPRTTDYATMAKANAMRARGRQPISDRSRASDST